MYQVNNFLNRKSEIPDSFLYRHDFSVYSNFSFSNPSFFGDICSTPEDNSLNRSVIVNYSNSSCFKNESIPLCNTELLNSLTKDLSNECLKYARFNDFCNYAKEVSGFVIECLSKINNIKDAILEFTLDMSVFYTVQLKSGNYAYIDLYYNKNSKGDSVPEGLVLVLTDSEKNKKSSEENCFNNFEEICNYLTEKISFA